jgi:hypothetical protein
VRFKVLREAVDNRLEAVGDREEGKAKAKGKSKKAKIRKQHSVYGVRCTVDSRRKERKCAVKVNNW